MTNKEAIDELSVIHERLSHPEDCENGMYSFRDGDYLEALDLAIKALENERPQGDITNEDIQQAIKEGFANGYEMAKAKFSPKQGEWKVQPYSMIMKCSLCGNEENAKDIGTINPDKHFCSFCGAKMEEAQNEIG